MICDSTHEIILKLIKCEREEVLSYNTQFNVLFCKIDVNITSYLTDVRYIYSDLQRKVTYKLYILNFSKDNLVFNPQNLLNKKTRSHSDYFITLKLDNNTLSLRFLIA